MVEYRKARAEEAADILDFINYVFSQAHRPHDFTKFNPPMYGSDYPFWKEHYVAVEDGRIKATLSITERTVDRGGVTFKYGHVGQVSVHPYARGAGHMKKLMKMSDDDMIAAGYDYAELGGLRQRYGYFGYTQSLACCKVNITPTNMRHALGRPSSLTAQFDDYEHFWSIRNAEGCEVGRLTGSTLSMNDLSLTVEACDALLRADGRDELHLSIPLYDTEMIGILSRISEGVNVGTGRMLRIYNFPKYIQAGLMLRARAGLAPAGEFCVKIDGKALCIRVSAEGEVSVEEICEGCCSMPELTAMQAQEMLCSPVSQVLYPMAPAGWFPLSI